MILRWRSPVSIVDREAWAARGYQHPLIQTLAHCTANNDHQAPTSIQPVANKGDLHARRFSALQSLSDICSKTKSPCCIIEDEERV